MPAIAIMHVYVKITKSGVVYCESIPEAFVSKVLTLKKIERLVWNREKCKAK